MKRYSSIALKSAAFLALFLFVQQFAGAQVVNEAARKKVSIGVGMFTDIWVLKDVPSTIDVRGMNQGFNVFATYNMALGKGPLSIAIGLGFRAQNLYGNWTYKRYDDSTSLVPIPDSIDYQRSKLALPVIELPLEFRYTSKSKVAVAVGFKVGYLLPAHTKYVGEDYLFHTNEKLRVKFREDLHLQNFTYGPMLRIGYKFFHVFGYMDLNKLFKKDQGPEMYPISVGFFLMPY